MKKRSTLKLLALGLGLAAKLLSPSAQAANKAWSTNAPGPANGNFSGTNWTVGTTGVATPTSAAASGDALYFDTSAITTLNNDLSGATFVGITFNLGASAYTIGGNSFTLSAALTNNSSSLQTFSNATALGATQTITGAGNITLSGALSGAGTSLTKSGAGTLTLSGTGTNSLGGNLVANAGRLNVTGGTTNFAGSFSNLGNSGSTAAIASISSGATLGWTGANGGNFGNATSASGVLYNSGTFNISGTTTNNAGTYLGNAANAYGYLRNDGSATTTVSGRMWISQSGNAQGATGVLDMRGGTVTVNGTNQNFDSTLLINGDGNNHTTSTAYAGVNVVNGTLTVGKAGAQVNINGAPAGGSGQINVQNTYTSFNIAGSTGKFTAGTGDSGIGLGVSSNATNIATLSVSNGGTLETAYIFSDNALGSNTLSFDNGTIKALAFDAGGLIQGTNIKAYIFSGGMTVDSNGVSPTISTPLLAPSGNGVTSITLGGTATGYVGAPVVKISGGGGTGAAAVANFDPTTGTVTGITITSPGTGYISAPTVTLVGGNGGSTGAGTGTATATAAIAAVTGGGLTKTGAGTLTLAAANTYTGATQINAGILAVNGSLASGSAVTIGGSSATGTPTLTGTGTVNGSVSVASAGGGAAGTINPGTVGTVGTLTLGNGITFNSGSTFGVDVANDTKDLLSVTGSASLAGTLALNATGTQTLGKYQLLTATTVSGTFGTVTGTPSAYLVTYASNEVDLQHKADQTITSIANLGRRLSGSTVTGANLATLNNTSPSGGLALTVGLGSSGPGNGSIGSLAASTGSTVSAAGSATITGNVNVGTSLGAQSFTLTNTDGSAITTSASNTGGQVIVLADRSGNITVGLGDIGRRLAGSNLSLTGQTLSLTSTGSHNQYTDVLIGGTTYDGTTTTGTLGGQNASITGVANSGSATISVAPTNAETNFSYTPATLTSASYTATAVNARTLTASTTVNFGRYLQNTTGNGSTAVTSTTGDHATLADVTLVTGPTTISGFGVTGSGTNFNGTNGTGSVSLSKNFGAGVTGSQTGSISLTEANNALSPEMAGGANALSVNYNANPVASRTVTNATVKDLGRMLTGSAVSATSNATGNTYGSGGTGAHADTEDSTIAAYTGSAINGLSLTGGPTTLSTNTGVTRTISGNISGTGTVTGALSPWVSRRNCPAPRRLILATRRTRSTSAALARASIR